MSIDQTDSGFAALPHLPQRSVLADEVYDIIRFSLVSHRIKPGTKMNLDKLSRELHVSNTPIRQALARLEADGLVTKEPYRGFTASPLLDSRAIAELYDYRLILEPTVAARAARRRSNKGVTQLHELCDEAEIDRVTREEGATQKLGDRDCDFHGLIAHEAGNRLVEERVRSALAQMSPYSLYNSCEAVTRAWDEHGDVVAAIEAADAKAAAAAMRTHLTNALERFRSAIA